MAKATRRTSRSGGGSGGKPLTLKSAFRGITQKLDRWDKQTLAWREDVPQMRSALEHLERELEMMGTTGRSTGRTTRSRTTTGRRRTTVRTTGRRGQTGGHQQEPSAATS